MNILGLNWAGHDSAAALLRAGKIIAAAEQERFSRKKHDKSFPFQAIDYCLKTADCGPDEIDEVAVYWDPWHRLNKRLWQSIRYFPKSLNQLRPSREERSMVSTWWNIVNTKRIFDRHYGVNTPFVFLQHHLCHAADTFFSSPFEDAAVLSLDGTGEWTTTLFASGEKSGELKVIKEISLPHSLGALYGAFTQYLGWRARYEEGKVMALAAYGRPAFISDFDRLLETTDDGDFKLDPDFFTYHYDTSRNWYTPRLEDLLGPARSPGQELTEHHIDIASTLQVSLEKAVIRLLRWLKSQTRSKNLCLAGGIGLNTALNSRILTEGIFEQVFVPPAPHDAGTSVGAARFLYFDRHKEARTVWGPSKVFLGPDHSPGQIEDALNKGGYHYRREKEIASYAARSIADGKVVAWFQGRMEFGPRALGNRSILADPRRPEMKDLINYRVKQREWFQPFACSVMADQADRYFDGICPSTYMSFLFPVKPDKQAQIPAVVHIDGSSRVQTVGPGQNALFYQLIKQFSKLTTVPLVLNTSLNLKGEPIACTPEDALSLFDRSPIDCLIMDRFVVERKKKSSWKQAK